MAAENQDVERIDADNEIDGDGVYPFAGLTKYSDSDAMTLPESVWDQQSSMKYWARNKIQHRFEGGELVEDVDPDILPERGLATMIDDLPRAAPATVHIEHPRTGEMLETLKSKAVVNPEKIEDIEWSFGNAAEVAAEMFEADEDAIAESIQEAYAGQTDAPVRKGLKAHLTAEQVEAVMDVTTGDDALYHVPTASYTIINPAAFLRPLTEVLADREWDEKVFGEVRLSRGGGRATLDLFVDGNHVETPVFADDREPVVVGLRVDWDFFGDWAVRASGQALDWNCDNRISRLTDREIVKHAGDVESRQDWTNWFETLLDRLEEKRDQLSRIIEHASEETLDLSELPDDIASEFEDKDAAPWTALYAYMDLPGYLAEHAGKRLRAEAEDPYGPNWWEIHSAATFAVTHHSQSGRAAGGAYEDQARVANDMLFNPATMEERIVENYEADRSDEDLADQQAGVARIQGAFESVAEKKERFDEWEEDLRDMGIDV